MLSSKEGASQKRARTRSTQALEQACPMDQCFAAAGGLNELRPDGLDGSPRRETDFGQRRPQKVESGPHDIAFGTTIVTFEHARKPNAVIIADALCQLGERHRLIRR